MTDPTRTIAASNAAEARRRLALAGLRVSEATDSIRAQHADGHVVLRFLSPESADAVADALDDLVEFSDPIENDVAGPDLLDGVRVFGIRNGRAYGDPENGPSGDDVPADSGSTGPALYDLPIFACAWNGDAREVERP